MNLVGNANHFASKIFAFSIGNQRVSVHSQRDQDLWWGDMEIFSSSHVRRERISPIGVEVDGISDDQLRVWWQTGQNVGDFSFRLVWYPPIDGIGGTVRIAEKIQFTHLALVIFFSL